MTAALALVVLHHHVRAAGVDYIGVFLASGLSWATLPGPGEAALIAAGISAAHGHLDLAAVLATAWAGATTGGTVGWVIGVKGGRGPLTANGPLHNLRLGLIAKGDRFFEHYGSIAVFFTPSWIAGIHAMRWSRFLPANAASGLVWAISVGVGAYLVGPSVADVAGDAGLAGAGVIAGVLVVGLLLVRRRSPS